MTLRSTVALLVAAWLPLGLAAWKAKLDSSPSGRIEATTIWQPAVMTPARTRGSTEGFKSISFARDGTGTAVSTDGGIWKSTDGTLAGITGAHATVCLVGTLMR